MEKWTIFDKSGVEKYIASDLEYHDIWMGEEYVMVKITSPNPIELEIGDFLIYRDEIYCIYNIPSALKQARKGSYGEAFKYENVKLSARSAELSEVRFLDVVLYDNNIHYTNLPTFSFYCETVDDLVDRLQANIDRYNGEWLLVTPNYNRTLQRYNTNPTKKAAASSLWEQIFGADHSNPTAAVENEKFNVNIAVDKINVSTALEFIKNNFGLNFITKGRALIVGGEGIPVDHVFRYGKNKGLYAIERKAENDQQVVTKLFAYGSDKNLPLRYYAELGKTCILNSTITVTTSVSPTISMHFIPDITDYEYYTRRSKSSPGTDENPRYVLKLTCGGVTVTGFFELFETTTLKEYRVQVWYGTRDFEEPDRDKAIAFLNAINGKNSVIVSEGISFQRWPVDHTDYSTVFVPNNMAVNMLMLPGFPKYSLAELCKTVIAEGITYVYIRKTPSDAWGDAFMSIEGEHIIRFSNERLKPYIVSGNADLIGIKEGNIQFNEENDDNGLQEVYPSIEGMTVGDVYGTSSEERIDEVRGADVIQDNGVFVGEDEIEPFKIKLKDIGFDLESAVDNSGSLTISMKDGYCGARNFNVKSVVADGTGWILNVDRCHDEALDLWFPYSSHAARGEAARADEAYQIRTGDHFVLLDIDISDSSYIWAASVKMLRKSIYWLLNNNYTRFTYLPKIDEIFMARQHERAKNSPATVISLHDTLKAGMLMLFNDEDLNVEGSVFIDNITIKESGNKGIPTYEVVLRNDKQVGMLQRVQQQVNSLSSYVYNGGGGYSVSQIKELVRLYGADYFLSKLSDDKAAGLITFLKGILVGSGERYGITAEGNSTFLDMIFDGVAKSKDARQGFMDGKGIYMDALTGVIEADGGEFRGFLRVMELIINRLQLMESDYSFTEGDTTERVDWNENHQRMILTMHKDHDNDYTPFYPGDILYAKINDLLPKGSTIPDGHTVTKNGSYYTCWIRVVSVDHTNNTITVAPYNGVKANDDPEVPGARNFTFLGTDITDDYTLALQDDYELFPDGYEKIVTLTRHGNVADGLENGDDPTSYSNAVKQSQLGRQQSWVLSTTDKRLSFFWNVDKPIIDDNNYALCLGILPNLANLPATRDPEMPSLYVNTIFYDHQHAANYPAKVVKEDRGHWIAPDSTVPQPTIDYEGSEIFDPYHYKMYNQATWLRYRNDPAWASLTNEQLHQKMMQEWKVDLEISRVWNYGILWECLVEGTTQEPKFGCTDWQFVSGNTMLNLKFYKPDGAPYGEYITTRRTNIYIPIVPKVTCGLEDISDRVTSWQWKRYLADGTEDTGWGQTHKQRNITITTSDMPTGWSVQNPAKFECVAYIAGEDTEVSADITF